MAISDKNKGTTKGKGKAKEVDYSLVSVETLPTYSQRELREIAKHFGIKIPRTFHSQPKIADYLSKVMENDPLILKEKLREDKNLTSDQWSYVKQLCNMLCTREEIAHFFDMTIDQIQKACYNEYAISFTDFYARESVNGKISIRRAQMQSALGTKAVYNDKGQVVKAEVKANPTMQMYLGKVLLGQVEPKDNGKQNNEDAVTMEKLTDILLEAEGDGVFSEIGEFGPLDKAYRLSKESGYQQVTESSSAKGGLAKQ